MRAFGRVVVAAFVAGLTFVGTGSAAEADTGRLQIEMPGGPISLGRLVPGSGGTTEVRLVNDSSDDAEVVLQAIDVVDDENSCLREEIRDGDSTCDSDGGELSSWLQIAVSRGGVVAWQGSLGDLADGALVTDDLFAGETLPLEVAVNLPFAAGNDTMSDRVGFGLRWTAQAQTGESDTEILGVDAFADGAMPSSGVPLPFTGATVEPWLLWFAGVLVAGGCVLLAASRREARPAY